MSCMQLPVCARHLEMSINFSIRKADYLCRSFARRIRAETLSWAYCRVGGLEMQITDQKNPTSLLNVGRLNSRALVLGAWMLWSSMHQNRCIWVHSLLHDQNKSSS